MRVIAITQIWPNSVEPLSSPFNLQQFKGLAARCDLTVLAAVAHVPGLEPAYRLARRNAERIAGDVALPHPFFGNVFQKAFR